MEHLSQDAALFAAISREAQRQRDNLELIASENYASPAVREAMATCLTNKYAEGYPGRRYYGGCEFVDEVENLAIARAKQLFGAEHANVQPHSGSQANMAAYMALLQPGDAILGMDLNHGGHLTHGSPVNFSGKLYRFHSYATDENGLIDYNAVREQALAVRPRMIVAGASAYPRTIDFSIFRNICDEVGAYLMVDMAHIAGLVAAGCHPSPVPYADIVTTTPHKTLRGPRGGMILCRAEYAKAVDKAVFPCTQGGPLLHVIAAKAVCLAEALQPAFIQYQQQIVRNAAALADTLLGQDCPLVSGGTDNHLMLMDLRSAPMTGKQLEQALDAVHITANKNMIPNDPRKPNETSGLRLGTPAVTTRGMREDSMAIIGRCIADALYQRRPAKEIATEVLSLTQKYSQYL